MQSSNWSVGRGAGPPPSASGLGFVTAGRGFRRNEEVAPNYPLVNCGGRGYWTGIAAVHSSLNVGPMKRNQSTNQMGGDQANNNYDTRDPDQFLDAPTSTVEIETKINDMNITGDNAAASTDNGDTAPKNTGWNFAELIRHAEEQKWKDLPPMKKDFYREDPTISKMTDGQVETYRKSRNNITVHDLSGQNRKPKNPIMNFEQAFKDYPGILEQIRRQDFKEPSPVQAQVWPIALSGEDVIGIAQTGTGKTLAFLLPIFIHLDNQPLPREKRNGPGCIILSPTRELALQIHTEVMKYDYKGIKSVCIYGGSSRREQVNICTAGVDIVIATPGRLNDLVRSEVINVKSVTYLVLDEADRMLDMGFEPQIKKVLFDVRPDRHTIMTSATWPELVRELGQKYTKNPFMVFVGSLDLSAVHTVTQIVEMVEEEQKMEELIKFLKTMKSTDKVIIFVAKKNLADHLSSELICKGMNCQAMHGDRDQADREQALRDIKNGSVNILVATDLASRGLDILDITHVYNYDFPRNIEEYVHRVGRTGRAGRSGTSITLITKSDWRQSTDLIKILEEAKQEVPEDLRRMSSRYETKKQEHGGSLPFRPQRREENDGSDPFAGFNRSGRNYGGDRPRRY